MSAVKTTIAEARRHVARLTREAREAEAAGDLETAARLDGKIRAAEDRIDALGAEEQLRSARLLREAREQRERQEAAQAAAAKAGRRRAEAVELFRELSRFNQAPQECAWVEDVARRREVDVETLRDVLVTVTPVNGSGLIAYWWAHESLPRDWRRT